MAAIEKVWELLAEYRAEFQGLKETLKEQNQIIRDQQEIIRKQKEEAEKQEKTNRELSLHWEDITQQMRDQLKRVQQQVEATIVSSAVTPPSTFAEVARSSPSPQRNTLRSPSSGSTTAATANELFCMIDTSRVEEQDRGRAQIGSIRQAVESEVRTKDGQATWRCAAVVKNSRNAEQVKIICRDEVELQRVKEAALKTAVTGARVMRDQLYPVKVDNVNRTAILDGEGNILQGAAEALGAENNVSIGKITWLSNKETGKAYGSMVVYVTKKSDAKKLLDGKYFDLAGESACTNPFEPRKGPMQCFNCQEMGHKAFKCKKPQLNVRKRDPVQQSLMNDEDFKDYGVLAISEPYARMIDGKVVTSPMMHSNWTRILPTHTSDGPWPIRSMLWVRHDMEVVQMPIPSADLTAAVLRLPGRSILVVSVYVEGKSPEALRSTTGLLHDLIQGFRQGSGARTDVVLAGDFNSHDLLWGGDDVSVQRQGEAGPIIDLMNDHGLRSLLPRGTKTWQGKDQESTIDLVLTTTELADEVATCAIHPTDHGSDHRTIQTTFDITMPERNATPRLLFKKRPMESHTKPGERQSTTLALGCRRANPDGSADASRAGGYPRTDASGTAITVCKTRAGQAQPGLEQRAKEAAKEFHDAIRHQRKAHWDDFLSDDANIWKATKYLKAGKSTTGDRVPPLRKGDGSTTEDKADQADELLTAFFPPLPAEIEHEGMRPQRKAVPMPVLTLGEIEEKVMTAKPWKAPGEDELPTAVWRQLWPGAKDRIFALFEASLRDGVVPRQWRIAKIVPLKKPNKDDYTVAKAWRPISLLSTLGKILEAVVAERISYAVETYGLLPVNHFGARKRRSAEQALLLLQEQIYKAWRNHKVLSLISFDVKGAYNGVCKERLLERMKARGIPAELVRCIDAFCSGRTASVVVNGYTSEQRELPQAGLPQGSPLSPILFLFFNADLVQRRIKAESVSVAFVDDYSAWVTGPTAEANREGIQAIIDDALEWEVRSGATFETEKTTIIHFTRATKRSSDSPFLIRGQGRAQAITGAFRTVAKTVAMAEADIRTVGERHRQATIRLCINLQTLPMTHPLATLRNCSTRRFVSPMQKIVTAVQTVQMDQIEDIHDEYALPPWTPRIQVMLEDDKAKAIEAADDAKGIVIATSGSQKDGMVGIGGVVYSVCLGTAEEQNPYTAELAAIAMALMCAPTGPPCREVTILASSRSALEVIRRPRTQSGQCTVRQIYGHANRLMRRGCSVKLIWVPSKRVGFPWGSAAKTAAKEATQAGSVAEQPTYRASSTTLRLALARQERVQLPENELQIGSVAEQPTYRASSTTLRLALARQERVQLPENVGKHSKHIDRALPGKHTRTLYDSLTRKEADILVQLRTGMSRLNGYLHAIGATDSNLCDCGEAKETIDHFLFRCTKWIAQRDILFECARAKIGNLSFFLGGKAASDGDKWKPDMQAVRAAIKFAIETERLDRSQQRLTDN
ncbi:hypothetical protein HIM_10431 [Hirsutella minnesotensis 3608]|uniref:Reverse transcriptase n=1 Tax=Hirsutella minnesotensis 3608 TaxID=1043627 RepID=A0A0F7ZG29_9HYPO|nr:hypothetical protein HIM_10431 [Hirsutella minnesotensis 3608]